MREFAFEVMGIIFNSSENTGMPMAKACQFFPRECPLI